VIIKKLKLWVPYILSWIFSMFAIYLNFQVITHWSEENSLRKNGHNTTGVVLQNDSKRLGFGNLEFEFKVDGKLFRGRYEYLEWGLERYQKNQNVKILFDEDNPIYATIYAPEFQRRIGNTIRVVVYLVGFLIAFFIPFLLLFPNKFIKEKIVVKKE